MLLALEHKRLPYESHLLQFAKQEHKSPHMLRMNPRGRVPVLKDGDYVVFESLAVLYYLDRKYPEPPLFGRHRRGGRPIMRVICEYQAYVEPTSTQIIQAACSWQRRGTHRRRSRARCTSSRGEARTIEGRLATSDWIVGEQLSAADLVVFPGIKLLLRALEQREARRAALAFPADGSELSRARRWMQRVEALPGYERTYPPHWRERRRRRG